MRERERYTLTGAADHGEVELLALVLGTGAGGRSGRMIAADLLDRFGGVAGLLGAHVGELASVPGIGPARAVRVHAAVALGARARRDVPSAAPVLGPDDAHAALAPALDALPYEELHALYLDRRHRPLALRALSRGTDGFTIVDPRQVYRPAVSLGALAVVLAHNHPSGDPTPSRQDEEVTDAVARAGRVLGVPLVDHLVIGGGSYVSLAERGRLPAWSAPPVRFTT